MSLPFVSELTADQWRRVRSLRLASLRDSAEAFGGNFDEENLFVETQWRTKFERLRYLVASVEDTDAAIMSIENLDGDFGARCWIGGCWVDPRYRGQGLMSAMFQYVDQHAIEHDWIIQGLGVWTDNTLAINAYIDLGFEKAGDEIESTKHPGKFYVRMIRRP